MKILFVNASLKGHVHPTLEMAEVLIRRGHEVSYFTGEDFREAIQELGGTFVPFSDKLSAFYSGYRPSDRHPFFLLTEFMLSWDEAMLPEVIDLCRREKFDLLICDSVFGGAFFLRQILEVPVVVSHSTFAMRRAPVPDRMLEPGFHPQLKILSRSAVFVTHAGFNSTHEAILSGVPMLALPFANDQFIVAKRIAELGLGETMDLKAVTAEDLRAAIIRLDGDEAMRGRIRDMAEMMRSGPTREDAAVAIERLVESHRNAAARIEQLVR